MRPDDRTTPGTGALWVREVQEPDMSALRAADRRGGTYLRYFPQSLDDRMAHLVAPAAMTNVADSAAPRSTRLPPCSRRWTASSLASSPHHHPRRSSPTTNPVEAVTT